MANITVDYEKLQNSISLIDNEIKKFDQLFGKQNSNFELLVDNNIWYGTSKENCITKYRELKPKYEEVLAGLEKYKQFLINVGESYKAINNEADKFASNGQ